MGRIVAAYAYEDGRRVSEVKLDESKQWSGRDGVFVWIGFHEPTLEDLRTLQTQFGLHELAVEDALNAHQLPKVEIYGDQLFVALRTAALEGGKVELGETQVFVGKDYIITVRHGASSSYLPIRDHLEACPALLRHGVDYVLHAILDFVVDAYNPVLEAVRVEVDRLEERVLRGSLVNADIERIFSLRRQLVRLRRVAAPMAEVCQRLTHLELPFLDKNVRPYFRDVHDHALRASEAIDGLREVLTFVFEAGLLLETRKQNGDTRRFAAWAAILAVPTAIAGIYGMNFENMPELRTEYGYFVVLAVIFGICGFLYMRFKKADWL